MEQNTQAARPRRPLLGTTLQAWRKRKRFSLRALAEAAGLSPTYVKSLETGFDRRTGKEIRPSVDTLRRLADALADRERAEADRIYRELMATAGYLPPGLEGSREVSRRPPEPTPEETEILEIYRSLPPDERERVREMVKVFGRFRRRLEREGHLAPEEAPEREQ